MIELAVVYKYSIPPNSFATFDLRLFRVRTDVPFLLEGSSGGVRMCHGMILLRAGKFPLVGDDFKVHSLRDGRVAKISGAPRFVIHGSVVSVSEDDDTVHVEPLVFK